MRRIRWIAPIIAGLAVAATLAALFVAYTGSHTGGKSDGFGAASWTLTDFDHVEFGFDGRSLFSIGDGGSIDEWDIPSRRIIATFQAELGKRDTAQPGCQVENFAISARAHVLAARFECRDNPASIRLWDYSTGQSLGTIGDDITRQSGLAVSPDGTTLAAAGHGALTLWNIGNRTLSAQAALPFAGDIEDIVISHNARLIAAILDAPMDHRARVVTWNTDGRNLSNGWTVANGDSPFGGLAFSPDDQLLASPACLPRDPRP